MYQINIKILGRVQGVNFRRTIAKFAKPYGIKGYVKNLEDGSVECVAQGKEEQLNELLEVCQKGAGLSKVKGMSFEWNENPKEIYDSFSIKKDYSNFFVDQAHSFINLGKEILQGNGEVSYPNHVVIIPDGNRRWARAQGWKPWQGHKQASSVDHLEELIGTCKKFNVRYLTLWAFSTENWKRDPEEIEMLFQIIRKLLESVSDKFIKNHIRFKHLGRKDRLPEDILQLIDALEKKTAHFTQFNMQVCLDYNGRDDVVRAINNIIKDGISSVNDEIISKYLDTGMAGVPDPDLIIRTSGEKRTSGIMAYQSDYAELYFCQKHFPDFDSTELERAILDYAGRTRRFGGTNAKDLQNLSTKKLVDPTV